MAAAHARQVVHRDIKPANILVDRTGGQLRFVLTDFGIGRRAEGIQAEKHAGGTYQFMAPEQLRGRPGPQSDLSALGVVAYRLLAGRLPFSGPFLPESARQIQIRIAAAAERSPRRAAAAGPGSGGDAAARQVALRADAVGPGAAQGPRLHRRFDQGDTGPESVGRRRQEPVRRQLERTVSATAGS